MLVIQPSLVPIPTLAVETQPTKVIGLRTTLARLASTAVVAVVRAVREARMAKTNLRAVQKTATVRDTELVACTAAAVEDQAQALAVETAHQGVFVSSGVLAQTGLSAASRSPTVPKIRT